MAATKLSVYQQAIRLLADARLSLITDDTETRYALDDAWMGAVSFVLRQAPWRFALTTAALTSSGGAVAGYNFHYAYPSDWLRTHAVFVGTTGGRECPVDIREQQRGIDSNNTALLIRYVSNGFADPELAGNPWPEHFAQCVAAYLAFSVAERVTGERGAAGRMSDLFSSLLPQAVRIDAEPESRWLPFQRSGEMLTGARDLLMRAAWRFALSDAAISVQSGIPARGFSYSFAFPADRLHTHRLFIAGLATEYPFDVREQGGYWSANVTAFNARFVSSVLGLDSTKWPEPFRTALLAYLEAGMPSDKPAAQGRQDQPQPEWRQAISLAIVAEAEPPDPILPHQFDGSLTQGARDVLAQGSWKFAIKESVVAGLVSTIDAFRQAYAKPADWLRTLALFQVSADRRKCPLDIRETADAYFANPVSSAAIQCRYVSSTAATTPTQWPQPFIETLRAWFRQRDADPQDLPGALKSFEAVRDAALAEYGEPPDDWLDYQQSGAFASISREMRVRAFWRFAMRLGTPIATEDYTGIARYTKRAALPEDLLRARAIYALTVTGERRPVDVRQQPAFWYANAATFYVDYLSTDLGLDATLWPDLYLRAVHAELVALHAMADQQKAAAEMAALAFAEAAAAHADAPDDWLPFQLDGSFATAVPAVMSRGNWWWALTEREYFAETDQLTTLPAAGFAYRYPLPADHFKTHALFVAWDGWDCPINIRQTAQDWSTDAAAFTARYVSTAALDTTLWPQPAVDAVYAWLAWRAAPADKARAAQAEFDRLLAEALAIQPIPDDPWLRFQLDGSFVQAVKQLLEQGRWRFAIKTRTLTASSEPIAAEESDGLPVAGYTYRYIFPNDLLRTVRVYYETGIEPCRDQTDIDFVDEAGAYHANYTPITVRYVSRLGLDSTKWPAHFRNAALAWLEYQEARRDPAKTSIAVAKLQLYKDACREAERLDDARDRPRVKRPGQFVRARYGDRRVLYDITASIPLAAALTSTGDSGAPILTDADGNYLTDQDGNLLTGGSGG